jgi:hypothetical protein
MFSGRESIVQDVDFTNEFMFFSFKNKGVQSIAKEA